ncbi:MAG: DUF229 domain-containing protein [Caldithrix sp.]|nr:MAG: DUF229 domain-containing protein [Caldithrix sp.]
MANLIRKYNISWRRVFFDTSPTLPSFQILVVAVWFGLLCGFFEVGLLFTKPTFFHSDLIWMPLVSNTVLFTLIGLPLFLAARLWPGLFSPRRMIFIIAFLAFTHLRLISYQVHIYAWLIIAAGLALQITSIIITKPFVRLLIRRSVIALVIVAIGLSTVVNVVKTRSERDAIAKLPDPPPNASNVLLIVLDTVRSKSLSLYGYDRKTSPQLEQLAESGLTFERAWSPSPWTLPAHGSLLTGRFPFELSASWQNPLDDTYPTLAEVLSERGYSTAGFIANLTFCTSRHGINRGFIHYEDYPRSLGMFALNSYFGHKIFRKINNTFGPQKTIVYKDAAMVNKDFLDWYSKKKDQRPFFVFLNYFDAHSPYLSPEPFDGMFGPKTPLPSLGDAAAPWWNFTMEQKQVLLDAYEEAIAYVDHELGLLLYELKQQGILDKTLVIVTSDHGELFGEHKLFGHGNSLYRSLLHVPLLISFPSHVPANRRIADRVTLCDIPATILDLLNLEESSPFPGASLARYWTEGDDRTFSETPLISVLQKGLRLPKRALQRMPHRKGDMSSIILGKWHFIKNGDGTEEMYNINIDFEEESNLAGIEEYEKELKKCRETLDSTLKRGAASNRMAVRSLAH